MGDFLVSLCLLISSSPNGLLNWICHSWSFRSGSNDFSVDGSGCRVSFLFVTGDDYGIYVTFLLDLVLDFH